MSKKIIVPIDFSITSADALKFGCYLADVTGYDLEAVHVYDGYDGDREFIVMKGSARVRARVKATLDKFVRVHADAMTFTGMHGAGDTTPMIKTREVISSAINQLVKQSRREDVALIVMGGVGTGLSSRVTPVFGSVARSVAMRAACPVLLIPQVAGVPDIKKAAIAFNEADALIELSEQTAFLRKALSPKMSFTHVVYPDEAKEERMELDLMEAMMQDAFPEYYDVDFDLLPPGVVTKTLLRYTEDNAIDLLIMGRHPRNFLTRLLTKSEIAEMLGISGAPVLVIPLSEKDPQV
ncbi:MAG: universal stress protein [Bacteroidota bacterium]